MVKLKDCSNSPFFVIDGQKRLEVTDTTPEFIILQETTKRQVFVLDVSGSMDVITMYFMTFIFVNFPFEYVWRFKLFLNPADS